MDQNRKNYYEKISRQIIKALNKRRMGASYAETSEQAREEILSMIPEGVTVYRCGSKTLTEIGLLEALRLKPGVSILNDPRPGLTPEEVLREKIQGLTAEYLVTSTNAITLDGKLVNLDRTGNRVAAMLFGPRKVILAVGMNKVAPDLDTAMARVKHYAAPLTASLVGAKTPCVADGLCHDCRDPERLCNSWSVIEGQLFDDRIHVKLIGEDLGH